MVYFLKKVIEFLDIFFKNENKKINYCIFIYLYFMYLLFEWRIVLKCKLRFFFIFKVFNRGIIIFIGIYDVWLYKG